MYTVFTNGCFDIIHPGHIKLLEYCRRQGSKLIVGLNSDASVRRLKGPARPVNSEQDRKLVLESIRFVDEVIIFEDDTPYELIKKIQPDLIVKGGDYSIENVVGNDLCKVKIFNFIDGYSTTETIQDITNR